MLMKLQDKDFSTEILNTMKQSEKYSELMRY